MHEAGPYPKKRRWTDTTTFVLLAAVVFTIPFNEIVVIPGVGTLTRILGYVALIAAFVALVDKGRVEKLRGAAPWAFAFVIWAALSLLWTDWPEETKDRLPTFVRCLGLFWLAYEFVDTRDRVNKLFLAYTAGAWVCILGVGQSFESGEALDGADYARYAIGDVDPNDLAVMLALGIPMAWHLATTHKSRLVVWMGRIYIPAATVTTLLTGSRGGLLATIVGLGFLGRSFRAQSLRVKVLAVVVPLVALIVAFSFVPMDTLERFETIPEEIVSGTLSLRFEIWKAGFELLPDHLFLGVGAGAFAYELFGQGGFKKPRVAHSAILGVLFELGTIGCALFLTVIVKAILGARKLPTEPRRLCQFLLLVWIVGTATLSWEYQKATWLLFGLLTAITIRPQMFLWPVWPMEVRHG